MLERGEGIKKFEKERAPGKAAETTVSGSWFATVAGQKMDVKPVNPKDYVKLLGQISGKVQETEQNVVNSFGRSKFSVEEKGELAKKATLKSAEATKGLIEFENEMLNLTNPSVFKNSQTSKIFELKNISDFNVPKFKELFQNSKLNTSLSGNPQNRPAERFFVTDPAEAKKIVDMLKKNGHTVSGTIEGVTLVEIGNKGLAICAAEISDKEPYGKSSS
ncbi:hypothetical protein EPN28_01975 [Patescibacteria group bacterium]|nr:MAG: hypothetical protein EPN28_01975 [Patescibacteria group bacterium]